MAELTRPSKWKQFKEGARAHKGLILIILIVLAALIVVMLIYEENTQPTGKVVDDQAKATPLQESRIAKVGHSDVVITGNP